MQTDWPLIDVLVVTFDSSLTIESFWKCLLQSSYPREKLHLRVWDNNSSDSTPDILRNLLAQQEVQAYVHFHEKNVGFAQAINAMAEGAQVEFLVLLNPDAQIEPGFFQSLLAPALRYPRAAVTEGVSSDGIPRKAGPVAWCSMSASLIRSSVFRQASKFDSKFFLYGEDVDFCARVRRQGWECYHEPAAAYVHRRDLRSPHSKSSELLHCYQSSLFLHLLYADSLTAIRHYARLFRIASKSTLTPEQRKAARQALLQHLPYLPHFLRRRIREKPKNCVVFRNGFICERNL